MSTAGRAAPGDVWGDDDDSDTERRELERENAARRQTHYNVSVARRPAFDA